MANFRFDLETKLPRVTLPWQTVSPGSFQIRYVLTFPSVDRACGLDEGPWRLLQFCHHLSNLLLLLFLKYFLLFFFLFFSFLLFPCLLFFFSFLYIFFFLLLQGLGCWLCCNCWFNNYCSIAPEGKQKSI